MGDEKTRPDDLKRLNSILGKIPRGEVLTRRVFTPEETAQFIVSSRNLGYEWKFAKRIPFDMVSVRSLILDAYTSAGISPESVTENALQDAIRYGKDLTEPFNGIISGKDLHDGRMMVRYEMDGGSVKDLVEQRFLAAAATHQEIRDELYRRQYRDVGIGGFLWGARIRGLPEGQFDIEPEKYNVDVFNFARQVAERHHRGTIDFFTELAKYHTMGDISEGLLDEKSGELNFLLDNLEKLITHQKDLSKVLRGTRTKAISLVA